MRADRGRRLGGGAFISGSGARQGMRARRQTLESIQGEGVVLRVIRLQDLRMFLEVQQAGGLPALRV